MKAVFHTDDQIISHLVLPDPCPIYIEIKEKDITLHVGQRDWQWNLEDGYLVGQGTCLDPKDAEGLNKAQRSARKARLTVIGKRMERDRLRRKKNGTSPPEDDRISLEDAEAAIKAVKEKGK